jgi:YgiT-type zinc finger domain-containing protein
MSSKEKLIEKKVTYTLEYGGKFYIIENVPARVNEETGEQYFAPRTVEKLQKTILNKRKPSRTMDTPVYDFNE